MEWISISDKLPEINKETNVSENVLVVEGGQLKVMCLAFEKDDENELYVVWCNCYGEIHGEGIFDDNYEPTHWMPFPQVP